MIRKALRVSFLRKPQAMSEGDNIGKGTAADDGDESSTGKLVDALVDLGRIPEGFNEMSTKTGSN